MKLTKFLRTFAFAALLGSTITMMVSCKEDDEAPAAGNELGTITGTVTDVDTGNPIDGVTVTVSGGTGGTATTGSDGKYTVAGVSIETHSVTFSKTGWQNTGVTVAASKFSNGVATVNASLENASACIEGTVLDAVNGDVPFAGVTVMLAGVGTVSTDVDGRYAFENLTVDSYVLSFSKIDYPTVEVSVAASDFVNGVATFTTKLGSPELLPGKTEAELLAADKWYFDEYRGGAHGGAGCSSYPHWDWSVDFLATLDFWGNWEEQYEGTALRTRNEGDGIDNFDVFDSYVYGSKKITADNKILTLLVRTHDATDDAPAYFGVQVVDLSEAEPVAVEVGDSATHASDLYAPYSFDLSAYIGKEVIVAVGIYHTSDYVQLPIRRIAFASGAVDCGGWLPGTEVTELEGWHMTQEMVRSMLPNPNTSFTGVSPLPNANPNESHNPANYRDAYISWREVNHIATNWFLVPVSKDANPFATEGFIIRTEGSSPVSATLPTAYFATKFAITAANDQLTLKTRNFGSNYTFFKLTAIKEDGTVSHLAPTSNTADEASEAENGDGCWKFKHEKGSADNPEEYASFVYDLSQFNGSNVVLCLGVYKGESNTDENQLVLYSIELN
ncbi:MAG: carboxypeptidase regulatory-like domain-containing protein [Prevotellaceae bacterium]|nr:carboxypeptidase regulatory-like domain-containing protein [Prevotellaceae bacterium]